MARPKPSPTFSLSAWQRLRHLLEGRPLGQPVHTLLVHFPIGLFSLSLLFDLASRLLAPDTWLVPAAFYTLLLGLITGFVAALFGVVDWAGIRADHPGKPTANTHLRLNLGAMAIGLLNGGLRLGQLDAAQTPWVPLALSLVSVAVIYLSGFLGGRLVYDEGIGVGRHRRASDLPGDTLRAAAPAPGHADRFVPVAPVQRLDHAEALRVEVNGYVMAVVRVNNTVYAVQDFCTHRFGPLSDGRFSAGELECPWHGSRFDVKTGQVTGGPAKEPLKTFEARVVDGMIQVKVPVEPPSPEQAE